MLPFSNDRDLLDDTFNMVDGLVLSGGPDVDPKYFNEQLNIQTKEISPIRDDLEIYLSKRAIEFNKPVLAICRGCQVLNIAAGGSIYQDIYFQNPTILKHCQDAPKWYPTHDIQIVSETIHYKAFKSKIKKVNSFHHQAVKDLGEDFIASAFAPDGIIEAIEHKKCNFCVGVQYHPEHMWEKDISFLELWMRLVEASKR